MSVQLVIGASGLVGGAVLNALLENQIQGVGTSYKQNLEGFPNLDIQQREQVEELISKLRPTVIYLPASLTNVDFVELNPQVGYQVNVVGVQNIIRVAKNYNAKLVYFSSDYIFDGQKGPYHEDDAANPLCEYGRQKLIAEHLVMAASPKSLIIRTTVVYGVEQQKKNFVYRLIERLQARKKIYVPSDQVGTPTYVPDLACAVGALVQTGASGVYNVCGPERCTRYEFACLVAEQFGLDKDFIVPVTTDKLKQIAKRPLSAGMNIEKLLSATVVNLSYCKEGLYKMLLELRKDGEFS